MIGKDNGTDISLVDEPGIPISTRKEPGILPPYVEAALFLLCGLLIGAGMTTFISDNSVRDFFTKPDQLPVRLVARMERRLDLTPSQRADVETIIAEHFATFDRLRRQVQPAVQATLDSMRDDVAAVLDPDQRSIWMENFQRIREAWEPGPLVPTPAEETTIPHSETPP